MSIKPYPDKTTQEILMLIGFYSDGFCSGHCEHAPLRKSNPELNLQIEAWHDKYYSYPTTPIEYTGEYMENDTNNARLDSLAYIELSKILTDKLIFNNDYASDPF
jgi:hypothetical protein